MSDWVPRLSPVSTFVNWEIDLTGPDFLTHCLAPAAYELLHLPHQPSSGPRHMTLALSPPQPHL